jgi:hypothetical protein
MSGRTHHMDGDVYVPNTNATPTPPGGPVKPRGAPTKPDMVNHPPHYTAGHIECIDAIEAALGEAGFVAFLRGQVIKCSWRLGMKGPAAEDAAKARWYADRLAAVLARTQQGDAA